MSDLIIIADNSHPKLLEPINCDVIIQGICNYENRRNTLTHNMENLTDTMLKEANMELYILQDFTKVQM